MQLPVFFLFLAVTAVCEEVCLFIGYSSSSRASRDISISFKPDHNHLKMTMQSARSRSLWLELENNKVNSYFLRYRSHPFTAVLLRDDNVLSLDGVGKNELFAHDGDIIVIRAPHASGQEHEWTEYETDLFQYYQSIDILRLSRWEEKRIRSLVRKSLAVLIARVSCIPTVQLFPFLSSDDEDESSGGNSSGPFHRYPSSSSSLSSTSSTD